MLVGLMIAEIALPWFADMVAAPLASGSFFRADMLALTLGATVLAAAFAGIYPALVVSRHLPSTALRGEAVKGASDEAKEGWKKLQPRLKEAEKLASEKASGLAQEVGESAGEFIVDVKGKLEELTLRSMQMEAELAIFDLNLTPTQVRSIGAVTDINVIDRTQLILDIFAQHALSRDGRLQVELAQLKYLLPRLHLMQKSLSRLTGGIGGRGPGETKLEIRGRRARDRITRLEKQLKELGRKRQLRRSKRSRGGVPVVGLVGYTNAGKSTLLNALTRSEVLAEDRLFATLDTTSRRMIVPDARELVLTDTVGFIEHLPQDLLRAFKATLEELNDADVLLHVVDASDPNAGLHMEVVDGVLGDLGLEHLPRMVVLNKADVATDSQVSALFREHGGTPVSAMKREGLRDLMRALEDTFVATGHGDVRPAWQVESEQRALRLESEAALEA